MKIIASIDLELVRAGRESRESITIAVEQPRKISEEEWSACVTDPKTKENQIVSGNDAIQVLSIALNFVGNRMKSMKALGNLWFFAGTDSEFPVDAYFFMGCFHDSLEKKAEPVD